MIKIQKLILFIFFNLIVCSNVFSAKKKEIPFYLNLELSTKYMWRGIEYGNAPTFFPLIGYQYKGFNAFAMGAYATNGSHQEVDLGVSYSYKGYTVGLSDYYFPSAVGEKDCYFNFNKKTTGHSIEAYFTAMPFKIPLWLTLSTYVFGNDKRENGKQAYSSYIEIGYNHYLNTQNILGITCGGNLNKSFYTNYEDGFSIVNITLKYTHNLKIKDFTLPVSGSYIINPYKEKSYFTFSAYLNL